MTSTDTDNYYCRVCGLQYDEPVWPNETHGSQEICVCCECQFGYDDISIEAIRGWREDWLKEGGQWQTRYVKPPENWDLNQQLQQIPKKYL